jgi:hypothetical protein
MKNRYFIIAIMAVTFLIGCQNESEKNNHDAKDKIETTDQNPQNTQSNDGQMNNIQGMMNGDMMDMPQMMTNIKDMNVQMISMMQQMNHDTGQMQHSKETMSFMNCQVSQGCLQKPV